MTSSTLRTDPLPPTAAPRMVVASVPAGHVYVRHLAPEGGGGALRLVDPDPGRPDRSAQQRWWPPVMLDPGWVERAGRLDVVHLHFGFDARTPDELAEWIAALRRRGTPLLYTVHDLRNPHHERREAHDRQLDVLIPAADALVTLTPGAAAEIRRRWGREASVLPHPHVVPLAVMRAKQARRVPDPDRFRVGVHLKSLRAGMTPIPVVETLVEVVADLPGAVLQVDVHRDVMEPDGARHAPEVAEMLDRYAGRGRLDLRVHDYFGDDQLWDYLASLDASVLPYRFGTHSGWLEACRDVGTTVVAPTCGYFAEQGPVLSFTHEGERLDPGSLAAAVRRAFEERPRLGTSLEERRRQRRDLARAHDRLYADLTAGR